MTEPRKSFVPAIDPPAAVTKGLREGFSQLDRRAWLECLDPKHRYAKNLRAYYQAWDLLDRPGRAFLDWLDSDSFELDSCPRSVLEADTVHYCTEDEREQYAVEIVDGRILFRGGDRRPVDTGDKGWIFVVREGVIYAAAKRTVAPRFHHSSFFAGECVEVAGLLVARDGWVRRVYPHSGHYRPGDRQITHLLRYLARQRLDLSKVEVDAQHTMKVARLLRREGNKMKKTDCPHFMRGDALLHFLERKASAWGTPLFSELVQRQARTRAASVPTTALPMPLPIASSAAAAADKGATVGTGLEPTKNGVPRAPPQPPHRSTGVQRPDTFDYHQTVAHPRTVHAVSLASVFEDADVDTARYDPAGWGSSPPSPRCALDDGSPLQDVRTTLDEVLDPRGWHSEQEDQEEDEEGELEEFDGDHGVWAADG